MQIYEQVHKAYIDSLKNNFWDAWGIVASPKIIRELRGECMRDIVIYPKGICDSDIEKIFGLVLIPCREVASDRVYVVDEKLGKTILGRWQTERSE